MTLSLRKKLFLLILFLISIAGINGLLGLYGMKEVIFGLEKVYKGRVIPLQELKNIADAYAVNIVDTNHKVRNGNMTLEQGLSSLGHAQTIIQNNWKTYLSEDLSPQELQMIEKLKPLMKEGDLATERLRTLFKQGDMEAIAAFSIHELYPVIDPISEEFSKLIQLQLDLAKEQYIAHDNSYDRLSWLVIALMIVGSAFSLGLSVRIINRSLLRPLEQAGQAVAAMATGDLTRQLPKAKNDEVGHILLQLQHMQTGLQSLIKQINNSVAHITDASNGLAHSADKTAVISQQQSSAANTISESVELLSAAIDHVNDSARQAKSISESSGEALDKSGQIINDAMVSIRSIAGAVNAASITIHELANVSAQISTIVNVIRDIADQTNLLALNAAIEAARAGEQGRGFSVVADEVRKLAERTASSTEEITVMIEKIQTSAQQAALDMDNGVVRVNEGVALAQEAGDSVNNIREAGKHVSEAVDNIASFISDQVSSAHQVRLGVEAIARGADQNSQAIEKTAQDANSLKDEAEALLQKANQFKV